MKRWLLILALLLLAGPCYATTYYVANAGHDGAVA